MTAKDRKLRHKPVRPLNVLADAALWVFGAPRSRILKYWQPSVDLFHEFILFGISPDSGNRVWSCVARVSGVHHDGLPGLTASVEVQERIGSKPNLLQERKHHECSVWPLRFVPGSCHSCPSFVVGCLAVGCAGSIRVASRVWARTCACNWPCRAVCVCICRSVATPDRESNHAHANSHQPNRGTVLTRKPTTATTTTTTLRTMMKITTEHLSGLKARHRT